MLTLAVVLFGLVAFTRLPINLLPDLSYPSLTVETKFPGAAPAEVETLVTRRIEESVGILSGVRRLSSRSRPGLSQVTLEFAWGRDMSLAALDVRQKVDLVQLPKESEKPTILRFDPSNDPIMRLYLTATGDGLAREAGSTPAEGAEGGPGGETRRSVPPPTMMPGAAGTESSLYRLRYAAEELLKKDLESVDGVAAVKVSGGLEEEIHVRLDEGKLALVGLTPAGVQQALARENVNQAGGSLYEQEARYLVRANNEFQTLDDILGTILAEKDQRTVRLADVATVERSHKQREVVTRFAGEEAVELAIYKEGDANTVSVARAVTGRLEGLEKELPSGVAVGAGVDQSRFIQGAIDEVLENALLGGLLAMIVLYLFLKRAGSTLIIGVTIPVSIIATFFVMYRMGVSLNVMSLGGLALGVGMLVDNAVVVLEAIVRRREEGEPPVEAASRGAKEVTSALVGVTLTTVAVFLPVVFVEGFAAQLFRDQALTVSISILVSLVVALTLIPMVAARAGRLSTPAGGGDAPAAEEGHGGRARLRRVRLFVTVRAPRAALRGLRVAFAWLSRWTEAAVRPFSRAFDAVMGRILGGYPAVLEKALARPRQVVGLAAGLFALSVIGAFFLQVDLVPSMSQGEFGYQVELPAGTPLAITDRMLLPAQRVLAADPNVEAYSAVAGGAGLSLTSTGTEGENFGQIDVRMKPGTSPAEEQRTIAAMRAALAGIGASADSVRVKFQRPSFFSFRTPIEVEVYGDALVPLHQAAGELHSRLARVPGLVDVRSSAEMGNPELQVRFDRDALARYGLRLDEVAATVRGKVKGEVATRFNEGDREIDILVRSAGGASVTAQEVERVIVAQREGTPVFLSSVAAISRELGPSEIRRIGQRRAAVVSANLEDKSLGEAAEDVRAVLRGAPLPGSVTASLSGQEEERRRSFNSLLLALGLSLFLVYLVMAAEFESLLHPFVIFFTVPLGAIGVVLALLLTGQSVNVVVMIGVVMLGGIVVDNAIVLIDAVNQLRAEGLSRREALIAGGKRRLRPILMTTATTGLGLLPMAFGLGEGAELRQPLAITVIGGLLVSTVLTLVVIPVLYTMLDRKHVEEAATDAEQFLPTALPPPYVGEG